MQTRDRAFLYGAFSLLAAINAGGWMLATNASVHGILKDYQSLIGALVAVAAAVIAYQNLQRSQHNADRQIADAREAREHALERKRLASTAALPVALTMIGSYATACVQALIRVRKTVDNEQFAQVDWPDGVVVPSIPDRDVLGTIKECVEYAPLPVAEALAKLFGELQVQHARLDGLYQDATERANRNVVSTLHHVDSSIIDALRLYAFAGSLFRYARGETREAPHELTFEDTMGAASVHGLYDHNAPALIKFVLMRYGPREEE